MMLKVKAGYAVFLAVSAGLTHSQAIKWPDLVTTDDNDFHKTTTILDSPTPAIETVTCNSECEPDLPPDCTGSECDDPPCSIEPCTPGIPTLATTETVISSVGITYTTTDERTLTESETDTIERTVTTTLPTMIDETTTVVQTLTPETATEAYTTTVSNATVTMTLTLTPDNATEAYTTTTVSKVTETFTLPVETDVYTTVQVSNVTETFTLTPEQTTVDHLTTATVISTSVVTIAPDPVTTERPVTIVQTVTPGTETVESVVTSVLTTVETLTPSAYTVEIPITFTTTMPTTIDHWTTATITPEPITTERPVTVVETVSSGAQTEVVTSVYTTVETLTPASYPVTVDHWSTVTATITPEPTTIERPVTVFETITLANNTGTTVLTCVLTSVETVTPPPYTVESRVTLTEAVPTTVEHWTTATATLVETFTPDPVTTERPVTIVETLSLGNQTVTSVFTTTETLSQSAYTIEQPVTITTTMPTTVDHWATLTATQTVVTTSLSTFTPDPVTTDRSITVIETLTPAQNETVGGTVVTSVSTFVSTLTPPPLTVEHNFTYVTTIPTTIDKWTTSTETPGRVTNTLVVTLEPSTITEVLTPSPTTTEQTVTSVQTNEGVAATEVYTTMITSTPEPTTVERTVTNTVPGYITTAPATTVAPETVYTTVMKTKTTRLPLPRPPCPIENGKCVAEGERVCAGDAYFTCTNKIWQLTVCPGPMVCNSRWILYKFTQICDVADAMGGTTGDNPECQVQATDTFSLPIMSTMPMDKTTTSTKTKAPSTSATPTPQVVCPTYNAPCQTEGYQFCAGHMVFVCQAGRWALAECPGYLVCNSNKVGKGSSVCDARDSRGGIKGDNIQCMPQFGEDTGQGTVEPADDTTTTLIWPPLPSDSPPLPHETIYPFPTPVPLPQPNPLPIISKTASLNSSSLSEPIMSTPPTPVPLGCPVSSATCAIEGEVFCAGIGFFWCVNTQWMYQPCGAGTVCNKAVLDPMQSCQVADSQGLLIGDGCKCQPDGLGCRAGVATTTEIDYTMVPGGVLTKRPNPAATIVSDPSIVDPPSETSSSRSSDPSKVKPAPAVDTGAGSIDQLSDGNKPAVPTTWLMLFTFIQFLF